MHFTLTEQSHREASAASAIRLQLSHVRERSLQLSKQSRQAPYCIAAGTKLHCKVLLKSMQVVAGNVLEQASLEVDKGIAVMLGSSFLFLVLPLRHEARDYDLVLNLHLKKEKDVLEF